MANCPCVNSQICQSRGTSRDLKKAFLRPFPGLVWEGLSRLRGKGQALPTARVLAAQSKFLGSYQCTRHHRRRMSLTSRSVILLELTMFCNCLGIEVRRDERVILVLAKHCPICPIYVASIIDLWNPPWRHAKHARSISVTDLTGFHANYSAHKHTCQLCRYLRQCQREKLS